MKGILGRKAGMTTIFSQDGKAIPVTVIEVKPNVVLQVKTIAKEGYNSIKLGVEDKKDNKAIKAEIGTGKKASTTAKYFIREIRDMVGFNLGEQIIISKLFHSGQYVDVTGTSKGKGFQGSIKRHNQTRGPMAHGSKYHRGTGSLGDIRSTVKKTKKMPGHMGHEQITVQNLEVVGVNDSLNTLLVKGSIPGPNKSFIVVKDSIKEKVFKGEPVQLVNINELQTKNELLEEGKKYGAVLNSEMEITEMEQKINEAKIQHKADLKEHAELKTIAKELKINKYDRMKLKDLRIEVEKVKKLVASRNKAKTEENK